MPPQGGAPVPPQGGAPVAPEAPRKKSKLPRILVSLVVAAVVFGVAFYLQLDDPGNAKVGDCVAGASADDMKIVDCASGEARYEVIGRVEDKPESALETACQEYQEAEQAFWQGEQDKNGVVLCLKSAK